MTVLTYAASSQRISITYLPVTWSNPFVPSEDFSSYTVPQNTIKFDCWKRLIPYSYVDSFKTDR